MTVRYLLAWLPMVVFAILNGALRDFAYGRVMPELHARQLSTVALILILAAYVWFLDSRWPLRSLGQAVFVGAAWLVLTVLFESGMGRYVSHESWEQLLQAYNVFAGNFWVLVPLAVAVLPAMVLRLRRTA